MVPRRSAAVRDTWYTEPTHMGKDALIRALRWSERYTKTDMVYLAHGGAWLGLAQLVASLGAFILTVALANLLTQETFGEYRFLISGFLLLSIFALPGMQTALMESTPKGFRRNIEVAFRQVFKTGIIGSFIAAGVASYYYLSGNTSLALGFTVAAIVLPFFNASNLYTQYLKALKEFRWATIATTVVRAVLLATSVLAAWFYPSHAWIIFAAFILGQTIPNYIFHQHTARTHVSADDRHDPTLTPYAWHLTIMAALGLIAVQLDKIFVWHFIGAEELAIFFVAYAIPQEVGRFLQIIPQLAFPKFANADAQTIRATLPLKMWKYFLGISVVVALYVALCPLIFKYLFPHYLEAIVYSQVLMVGMLASAFLPIKTFLTVQKATRALYALSVIVPGIRILAAVILIALFGLWGAIAAILIESLIRAMLLYILFRTTYKN